MPNTPPTPLLAEALNLVEEALTHAESGDWDQVAELDRRLVTLVTQLAPTLANHDPESYTPGLIRLRERHHALRELAEQQRNQLVEDRRKSVRGRTGTRAYEDNA